MDRSEWGDLPRAARASVELHTGPVVKAEGAPHGVMSRLACTLYSEDDHRVFVKGGRDTDPQAWVYRHEAAVTRLAPRAPRVLWEVEAGGWVLYGYEYVSGRHPDLSPGSPDIGPLLQTLGTVSGVPWPDAVRKRPLHDRYADFLPDVLPAGMLGRTLTHTDLSIYNMRITSSGQLLLLDWALSCPGPSWTDSALVVPRLVSAGHSPQDAEEIAMEIPAFRHADPAVITEFSQVVCTAWEAWGKVRQLPHGAELTAAAYSWARHRRGGT